MIKGTEQQDVRIEKAAKTPLLKLLVAFGAISGLL